MTKNLRFLKKSVLLGVAFFMLNSGTVVFAQTEITVEPGFNTFLDAINDNPGATLILKRGGLYIFDERPVISVPTIIKGEKEPVAEPPALLRYHADPGQAHSTTMIHVAADLLMQDVAMHALTLDGQQVYAMISNAVDNNHITLDHCYFQSAFVAILNQYPSRNNLHMTWKNCQFMNLVALGWDNGGVGEQWAGDSVDFKAYNNTFFVAGRVFNPGGAGPHGSELMEHNTYVATWGDTYFPISDKDISIKNNIFYDTQVRGYVGMRTNADGDTIFGGDYSDWKLDSLVGDVPIYPHLNDSVGEPRAVNITNNLKMNSQLLQNFNTANNIAPQPFLNKHTRQFANDYGWNIIDNMLQEDGNAVDPEFTIPEAAYELMFQQGIERRLPAADRGEGYPYYYAWIPDDKTKEDFIWPFPVNLKPTNEALRFAGDDGYPLGDLNWYGPEMVDAWEAGLENPLTGVKDLTSKSNQSAYIANDILKFKGFDKAVNVEVYSILGQKVLIAKNINEINVSNLKTGVYLVRVNGEHTFKVAK